PFLLGGGDAERMVIDPLRIDLTDDVPDHPAFSRGVHTLEDEKDRPGVAGAPVREELLLEIGQDLAAFGEQSFAECLVPVEAGGAGGVESIDAGRAGADPNAVDDRPVPRVVAVSH